MSNTSSDTSAIDEKKGKNESSTYSSKIIKFIIYIVIIILIILIYFFSSGLVLFVSKLAQSNILPTDSNCSPYTDYEPNIKPIKTNIFSNSEMSMKLEFPYYDNDVNKKNIILDMFNEYKNKSSSNFLANYFISIFENLLQFDYSSINIIMNFLNDMPEIVTILFGPIIIGVLFAFMTLFNQLYFIYLFFANMSWFFKQNINDSGDGKPKWDDVTLLNPVNWWFGVFLVILFIILFFVGLPLLAFIPLMAIFYSTFSTIIYKGLLNGKTVSSFYIAKDALIKYKLTIVSIISLFTVILAFSNLGTIPGILSICILLLIYWGILTINLFNPINMTELSPLVSNVQAKRSCPNIGNKSEKHGFLYNLLIGQKGGTVTNDLKKISKVFNK